MKMPDIGKAIKRLMDRITDDPRVIGDRYSYRRFTGKKKSFKKNQRRGL
jgi:hypothetical protein